MAGAAPETHCSKLMYFTTVWFSSLCHRAQISAEVKAKSTRVSYEREQIYFLITHTSTAGTRVVKNSKTFPPIS